jgi:hypothetical protein
MIDGSGADLVLLDPVPGDPKENIWILKIWIRSIGSCLERSAQDREMKAAQVTKVFGSPIFCYRYCTGYCEWSAVPERRGCLACRCCCERSRSVAARGWWASRWGWGPRAAGTTAPQPRSTAAAAASTAHSDLRVTKKGLHSRLYKV